MFFEKKLRRFQTEKSHKRTSKLQFKASNAIYLMFKVNDDNSKIPIINKQSLFVTAGCFNFWTVGCMSPRTWKTRNGSLLLITLRDTKTKTNRIFSVVDNHKTISLLGFYKNYFALLPPNTESRHFFMLQKWKICTSGRWWIKIVRTKFQKNRHLSETTQP